jgi:hypothetical protein
LRQQRGRFRAAPATSALMPPVVVVRGRQPPTETEVTRRPPRRRRPRRPWRPTSERRGRRQSRSRSIYATNASRRAAYHTRLPHSHRRERFGGKLCPLATNASSDLRAARMNTYLNGTKSSVVAEPRLWGVESVVEDGVARDALRRQRVASRPRHRSAANDVASTWDLLGCIALVRNLRPRHNSVPAETQPCCSKQSAA